MIEDSLMRPWGPGRAPLLWLLGALVVGILLSQRAVALPAFVLVLSGTLLALASYYFSQKSQLLWTLSLLPAAILIFWGYAIGRAPVSFNQPYSPPREVTMDLKVIQVMRSASKHGQLSGFATITQAPDFLRHLVGEPIYFHLMPAHEGDKIVRSGHLKAKGVLSLLEPDAPQEGFNRFLESHGVHLSLTRGRILGFGSVDNSFYAGCFRVGERFEALLRRGAPEHFSELANPYVAMLLGRKAALTPEQKEGFAQSGTLHLFAISGLHVGIIALSLTAFLRLLRIPQKRGALLGLLGLYLYVQITEASPSAMRAFIMLAFFWAARIFLRQAGAFAALVASAFFVLLWQPRTLFDVGFQLSYAVVAAILLYGVPLSRLVNHYLSPWKYLPEASKTLWQRGILIILQGGVGLFCISFAATLMSIPLSIVYFQQCAPGGLFMNMVLVPLASLVIICGFISLGIGSIGLGGLAGFLNHAAWVLIYLMESTIRIFNRFSVTSWQAHFKHPYWAFGALAGLLCLLIGLASSRFSEKKRAYLAPPGVLIIFLLLGLNY